MKSIKIPTILLKRHSIKHSTLFNANTLQTFKTHQQQKFKALSEKMLSVMKKKSQIIQVETSAESLTLTPTVKVAL